MALPISSALRSWKEQESITDPIIRLYDLEVDDEGTVLRFVEGDPLGTGTLSYGGEDYLAIGIKREKFEQSIEGELPRIKLQVSNIDGVAGGIIETNDLEGRRVTITRVRLSQIAAAPEVPPVTWTVQRCSYNRERAVFELGMPNFFRRKLPWRTYQRHKCGQPYEHRFLDDAGCDYPSDAFEDDTTQDLRVGAVTNAEQVRLFGWNTINALRSTKWDTNKSVPNWLYAEASSQSLRWSPGNLNGLFLYKKLTGDFDLHTRVRLLDQSLGVMAGIACQEATAGLDTWIFFGRGLANEGAVIRVESARNAVSDPSYSEENETDEYLRMVRSGSNFTLYRSTQRDANWTQVELRTVSNMDVDVRVGLLLAAPALEIKTVSASWEFIQYRAGGLDACSRVIDDENGCEIHGNTHRFFGFRGIPRT